MDTFACDRCGDVVTKQFESREAQMGFTGTYTAKCPGCGAEFAELEISEIQENEGRGMIATIDALRATRMLGNPGNPNWVAGELRDKGFNDNQGQLAFPLSEIRRYANAKKIQITPLSKGQAFYLRKRK